MTKSRFACSHIRNSCIFLIISLGFATASASLEIAQNDFLSLSLEELMLVNVSSVSKQKESLSRAAASIFVITPDDIHNSGVTTLPEALRLAPNLQVARIKATQYAVTARGFNSTASNKLLVLIDGRTIYTPLFSGVFWDQHDVLLEDIERIEVISGPGAALWGSNAVNGVINIITKAADTTHGVLAEAHGGDFERGLAARVGKPLGNNGHVRMYIKAFEMDRTMPEVGAHVSDAYDHAQAGFRYDWLHSRDKLTVQGDVFDGQTEDRITAQGFDVGPIENSGWNVLSRWERKLNHNSTLELQAYWDHTTRRDFVVFQPDADIFDIDFQHSIDAGQHSILWGGGYRRARDMVDPGVFAIFVPESRTLHWENIFVQDQYQLNSSVELTLGLKLETNDFTDLEYLPSARFSWQLSDDRLFWSAVSRAVRAPSRYDRDVYFPAPPNSIINGGPNFESEVANVLEWGYRAQSSNKLLYSFTAFYHDWDKLRSASAVTGELENNIEGEAYGIELWANYNLTSTWRLSMGGTILEKKLKLKSDSTGPGSLVTDTLHNDPDYQAMFRSTVELTNDIVLDINLRHIADLPHPEVPQYTNVDAHLGWKMRDDLEISVVIKNVLDEAHREFEEPTIGAQLQRYFLCKLIWTP